MPPIEHIKKISDFYQSWFLDYASYVILERAIPSLYDGLKPVQRRIMHSLWELEDGRYNKVANVVGNTMKYHPHGDASIADAMVQIGQKELLIDTQGNWGNTYTGDRAAAARYIEARLSTFALEVLFDPKITQWQLSYDGRNKEPIYLPVKFPILLTQGVEGIAVGLSTKILPHNFNELIDAGIAHLCGKKFELYPDFPTSGFIDISQYNDGQRGGRLKIRAAIRQKSLNQLIIDEIPFGTSTISLIESIIKANEEGKIKIHKIEDNTSDKVEIIIHLATGSHVQKTIAALYAFTDCEISVSPTACVIDKEKPLFLGVSDILRKTTDHTVSLLREELEVTLHDIQETWHFACLERIFIDKRIYHKIEEQKTWKGVFKSVREDLAPYTNKLFREITEEDLSRLTEIRIKRISRFDLDKSQEVIRNLEIKITETKRHLAYLTDYAIEYFNNLRKRYGKTRERKTQIVRFENIDLASVALPNIKLYINYREGFIGTTLKKEEFLFECSDLDEVIIFRKDGAMMITRVSEKAFVGKDILYVGLWKKKDERTIYNMIYRHGKKGPVFMKRFAATGLIRDNQYQLTRSEEDSEVLYFSANTNGETEELNVYLKSGSRAKKQSFTVDLAQLLIKGKNAKGNLLTKYPVRKISLKSYGAFTLSARQIWFDEENCSLNSEGIGKLLGNFQGEDQLLVLSPRGIAELIPIALGQSFSEKPLFLEKWQAVKAFACMYFDAEKNNYFLKRFLIDKKTNPKTFFIQNHQKSFIRWVSSCSEAYIELNFFSDKEENKTSQKICLTEFTAVENIKAKGKALSKAPVRSIKINELFKEKEEDFSEKNETDQKGEQISLEL